MNLLEQAAFKRGAPGEGRGPSILGDSSGSSIFGVDSASVGNGLDSVSPVLGGISDFLQQKQNARILDQQASQVGAAGELAAFRVGRQGDIVEGQQRAAFAAGGVDTTSGTSLALLTETAAETRLNEKIVAANAENQQKALKFRAGQARAAGRRSLIGGLFKGAGSAVSSGLI